MICFIGATIYTLQEVEWSHVPRIIQFFCHDVESMTPVINISTTVECEGITNQWYLTSEPRRPLQCITEHNQFGKWIFSTCRNYDNCCCFCYFYISAVDVACCGCGVPAVRQLSNAEVSRCFATWDLCMRLSSHDTCCPAVWGVFQFPPYVIP